MRKLGKGQGNSEGNIGSKIQYYSNNAFFFFFLSLEGYAWGVVTNYVP